MAKEIFEKLNLDRIDQKIIHLLHRNPGITHSEIGSLINRSQPTIGNRIRKLRDSGILKHNAVLNHEKADLVYAKIELESPNIEKIFSLVKDCPFMINVFRTLGDSNIMILVVGSNLKMIDDVINFHFRNNLDVSNLTYDIISQVANDLIISLKNGKCTCKQYFD